MGPRFGSRSVLFAFTFPLLLACNEPSEPAATTEPVAEEIAPAPPRGPTTAVDPEALRAASSNPLDLPDRFHGLLLQEMVAIEGAMAELGSQLARGQRDEASATAERIHASFILKQELSQEELHALVSSLPSDFVHRDRAFHGQAKQLAEALGEDDWARATTLYGEMTQACVGCHAAHAKSRFTAFEGVEMAPPEAAAPGEAHDHHHE